MGRSAKSIDWDAIERDYRIGQLTVRQIGEKHGVAYPSVSRKAKKCGWKQDLTDVVRSVTAAKVTAAVAEEANKRITEGEQATYSEVELAANANVAIIMRHQKRAVRLGSLLENMLGELEEVSANPATLEQLVLAVGQNDPLAADGINQLRSVHKRMDTLKVASEINIKVQDAERKACSIDGEEKSATGLDDAILKIAKAASES